MQINETQKLQSAQILNWEINNLNFTSSSLLSLLIKNGNSIDAAALYDSYEVEYLPNEGLVSASRHLFVELTTDAAGTSTGFAVRYQGEWIIACLDSTHLTRYSILIKKWFYFLRKVPSWFCIQLLIDLIILEALYFQYFTSNWPHICTFNWPCSMQAVTNFF